MIRPCFSVDWSKAPKTDLWGCAGWLVGMVALAAINAAVIYGIVKVVRWAWEG